MRMREGWRERRRRSCPRRQGGGSRESGQAGMRKRCWKVRKDEEEKVHVRMGGGRGRCGGWGK